MTLVPLKIPPGMYKNGTVYQAKGRWYHGSLVRFFEGTIRPIGGWEVLTALGQTEETIQYHFDDQFTGVADVLLSSHSPDFPFSGVWDSSGSHFSLDGTGLLQNVTTDGAVYKSVNNADLGTWEIGREAWFDTVFPASGTGASQPGLVWMHSKITDATYAFRVTRIFDGSKWDLSIQMKRFDPDGDEETEFSKTFNITNAPTATQDLPAGNYRFGITVVSATRFDLWHELDGDTANRVAIGSWTGGSSAFTGSRLDSEHTRVGVYGSLTTGTPKALWSRLGVTTTTTPVDTVTITPWVTDLGLSAHSEANFLEEVPVALPTEDTSTIVSLEHVPRAILGWRGNDGNQLAGIGTTDKLFVHTIGKIYDITPGGFVAGLTDTAMQTFGGDSAATYGDGLYGAGLYGVNDPAQQELTNASVWQLDTFGDFLVGCSSPNDGKLYYWDKDLTHVAQAMTGAPTACSGIVVTPERFVFALGAGGEARRIEWASQESLVDWTPTVTNTAGGWDLEGVGVLVTARRLKSETLIWTTDDLHTARYIGSPLVYSFERLGSKCGLIAPGAVSVYGESAVWMGQHHFYVYDGYTRELPCEVGDYVFSDFNFSQKVKTTSYTISEFGEVTWHYPSAGSVENDRYVKWNYLDNTWVVGELSRTAGCDAGALAYPILAGPFGTTSWRLYEHERGQTRLEADGTQLTPSLSSGPIDIADGDVIAYVSQLIPDEKTLGDLQFYLYTTMYPGESEVRHGPFTINKLTDVRFSGRQVRLETVQANETDWRLGVVRLDVKAAGRR